MYSKAIYIAVLPLIAVLFFEWTSFASQNAVSFQLFFTGDVYGYLKPCG
jgi:hypothetical protein